jgi:uncharacterized membrane protein (DUF373 family)
MQKRFKSRFSFYDRWLDRHAIILNMEAFQDLIMIVLCLSLFAVMFIQVWGIFIAITQSIEYKQVTAKMVFVLILVELFRLLILYLQEYSIAVSVAVEVAIVSVLREVVVHGALEISGIQTAEICGLLFILGGLLLGLLLVCGKKHHMDCMSANTKYCPIAHQERRE